MKTVKEHVTEFEKVIDKVHSILKSHDIPISCFDFKLANLHETVSNLSDSLKMSHKKL